MTLEDVIKTKKIGSVVINFEVNKQINLENIFQRFSDARFIRWNGRNISLVVNHIEKNIKYIIWKTGKIRAMGIKNIIDIKNCSTEFLRFMKKHNLEFSIKNSPIINNISVSINMKKSINLNKLILSLNNYSYEPESFPAIIFKPNNIKNVTYLIFSSGKIVIVGLKFWESIDKNIEQIYVILSNNY